MDLWEEEDRIEPRRPLQDPIEARTETGGDAPTPPWVPEIPEEPEPATSTPKPLNEIQAAMMEALRPVVALMAEAANTTGEDLKQTTKSLQDVSQDLRDVKTLLADSQATMAEVRKASEWLRRQRETYKAEMEDLKHQHREGREAVARAGIGATNGLRAVLFLVLGLLVLNLIFSAVMLWKDPGKPQQPAEQAAPKVQADRPPKKH